MGSAKHNKVGARETTARENSCNRRPILFKHLYFMFTAMESYNMRSSILACIGTYWHILAHIGIYMRSGDTADLTH